MSLHEGGRQAALMVVAAATDSPRTPRLDNRGPYFGLSLSLIISVTITVTITVSDLVVTWPQPTSAVGAFSATVLQLSPTTRMASSHATKSSDSRRSDWRINNNNASFKIGDGILAGRCWPRAFRAQLHDQRLLGAVPKVPRAMSGVLRSLSDRCRVTKITVRARMKEAATEHI